ncbi:hypothetical protein [uncultured Desulfovibrio sp.]|uniref:hypothetical protein n=1 Tax=uncultured Desulfovibrio sp. TaxID=167968 RepID=UPI0026119088|nr:hypothetical protein [uncultured Desulfovibrio sp.]
MSRLPRLAAPEALPPRAPLSRAASLLGGIKFSPRRNGKPPSTYKRTAGDGTPDTTCRNDAF